MLNVDGTVAGYGTPIESYAQADVAGLARVFTGLGPVSTDTSTPNRNRAPLVMNASRNETGTSSFLGTTVSGGGMAAVRAALDTVFAHPQHSPSCANS
ncbi:DUF1800 family protein [Sphingomonas sp. MMS24-JH45]